MFRVPVSVSKFKEWSVFFPALLLSVGTIVSSESLHPCKLPSCQDIQLVTWWHTENWANVPTVQCGTNMNITYFYADHEIILSKQGTTLGSTSVRNLFAMMGPSVDTFRMCGMSEIPYTQTLCRHLPWVVTWYRAHLRWSSRSQPTWSQWCRPMVHVLRTMTH